MAKRFSGGSLRRVIPGEHTGLLERSEREALESRFKSDDPKPWFENLLSATPTLVRVWPLPTRRIVGECDDMEMILRLLEVSEWNS